MTEITMIPLSKLVEGKQNARRTDRSQSIGELCAAIEAHGLLQSLVVAECGNGRYSVEAGGRRLKALRKLAKCNSIANNEPIPCRIVPMEAAAEASLAENCIRVAMHPVDEIVAMAALCDAGEGPEAIAGRFGVTSTYAARRLKLARVSPLLIEAFRKDELTLDQLSALAFSDDHAAQERAFFDAPDWARTPERLRAQITQAHAPDTDKLARFVGIDAYKAEGGAVTSDLFADEDDEPALWLTDRALLVRLAEAKLRPIAAEVSSEGWSWVEIAIDEIGWTRFPMRVREERRRLTKREQARLERLYAKLDEVEDAAEIQKIETDIDALAPTSWPVDEVKLAGAIVTLTRDGAPKVERGLVRDDDVKALKTLRRKAERSQSETESDTADHSEPQAPAPRLSAKLIEELQAHKTLALRTVLAEQPAAALRVLVFTLAERFVGAFTSSPLDLKIDDEDVSRSITRSQSKAPEAYEKIASDWRNQLPGEREALWRYVSEAEQQALLELLAVMVAPGLDLRTDARMSGTAAQIRIGDLFAEAVELDMSQWWTASVDSYFSHVKRDVILDAIREHKPALCVAKLEKASKAELISRAKRIFKGSTWLPEPLRTHSVSVQAPANAIAAE